MSGLTWLLISSSAIFSGCTILGNSLVLVAYFLEPELQIVSNIFLLSLASADLLIGCISMPIYTAYLVAERWPILNEFCKVWLSLDYTLCNASVTNLLLISIDRYLSVTRPLTYRARRSKACVIRWIIASWVYSTLLWALLVYFYPLLEHTMNPNASDMRCEVPFLMNTEDERLRTFRAYFAISSTVVAFYAPVILLIILYSRIFCEARKRQQRAKHFFGSVGTASLHGGRGTLTKFLNLPDPSTRQKESRCCVPLKAITLCRFCRWKRKVSEVSECGNQSAHTSPLEVPGQEESLTLSLYQVHPVVSAAVDKTQSAPPIANTQEESPFRTPSLVLTSSTRPPTDTGDEISTTFATTESGGLAVSSTENYSSPHPLSSMDSDKPQATNEEVDPQCVLLHRKPSPLVITLLQPLQTIISSPNPTTLLKHLHHSHSTSVQRGEATAKNDLKTAKILSAIISAFILTWLPYNVFIVFRALTRTWFGDSEEKLYFAAYYLCYLNSTINPLLYALCNSTFRTTFVNILLCRWRRSSRRSNSRLSRNSYRNRTTAI